MEEALLQGEKITKKRVEGLEGEYTTKADMKKAWASKLRNEEKEAQQQFEAR